jgi:voltage-gated potassium channel
LTAFSLFVPALRTLRILQVIRPLRSIHAVRGLQLLQVMTRTNRHLQKYCCPQRKGFRSL